MDNLNPRKSNSGSQQSSQQSFPYASSFESSTSSSPVSSTQCGSSKAPTPPSVYGDVTSGSSELPSQTRSSTGTTAQSSVPAQDASGKKIDPADTHVPSELRRHPRRTARLSTESGQPKPPPTLVRSSQLRVNFVDQLVDSASQIVETIWPRSVVAVASRNDNTISSKGVLPLRSFIQETLRRSRSSYSTLQVALYYLILIKPRIPSPDDIKQQGQSTPCSRAMQCGRRMFLSSLILASKYLQDRNYSARAWSKISGLSPREINQNELIFLEAVKWKLHIAEPIFNRWTAIVLRFTPPSEGSFNGEGLTWKSIIPTLTPELDTIDVDLPPNRSIPVSDLIATSSPGSLSPSLSPEATCQGNPMGKGQESTLPSRGLPPRSCPRPQPSEPIQLPNLAKLGILPSANKPSETSTLSLTSCRPSMIGVMRQMQSMCTRRTTLDQRPPLGLCRKPQLVSSETYPPCGRRSSLACSSTSSPDSMVSDVPSLSSSLSSRSSRSSSISSINSGNCVPAVPHSTSRATRRFVKSKENRKPLTIASPIDEVTHSEIYASPEPMSAISADLPDIYKLAPDSIDMAHEAAKSLCQLSVGATRTLPASLAALNSPSRLSRKRGRNNSSSDTTLQNKVRHLMAIEPQSDGVSGMVIPDARVAESFMISQHTTSKWPSKCPFESLKILR